MFADILFLCLAICEFNFHLLINSLLQYRHSNDSLPVWVDKWKFKEARVLNIVSHIWHLNVKKFFDVDWLLFEFELELELWSWCIFIFELSRCLAIDSFFWFFRKLIHFSADSITFTTTLEISTVEFSMSLQIFLYSWLKSLKSIFFILIQNLIQ